MQEYFDLIDKANDIYELTEIVEERAAFDDSIINKEYCEIVEYANIKIKSWRCVKWNLIGMVLQKRILSIIVQQ